MRGTEFCYWLQGYFELLMTTEFPMSRDQLVIVRKHLEMVKKVEGTRLKGFPAWLEPVLDVVGDSCDAKTHKAIIKKLGEVFEHEIDKGYPDPDGLNDIHNDGRPGGTVFRC